MPTAFGSPRAIVAVIGKRDREPNIERQDERKEQRQPDRKSKRTGRSLAAPSELFRRSFVIVAAQDLSLAVEIAAVEKLP
jgi:hypothetical protein